MPTSVSRLTWKIFVTWWVLGSLSMLAVFPSVAAEAQSRLTVSIPQPVFFAGQYLQLVLVLGLAVWLGWRLAPAAGLGAPLLEAWFSGQPVSFRLKSSLLWPALWGLLLGAALSGLDAAFFSRGLFPGPHLSWGGRLLVTFYAGIGEELWMRWCLVTLGMWLLVKLLRIPAGASLPAWAAWLVIALVSAASGLGPLRSLVTGESSLLVGAARFLLLNGAGGLVFGWCYWRRGAEAAMACHWAAALVTRVVLAG